MAASSVAAFWALALLLIIVPGADWAFTISSGLQGHSALPAVSGLMIGYAGITVVVAAGAGALVAKTPALLTGLTIVGGLYLLWHGARTFARPSTRLLRQPLRPAQPGPPWPKAWVSVPSTRRAYCSSSHCSLNSAIRIGPGPFAVQLGFLGLVFMMTCAAFYLCLGSFARKTLHARPAAARGVTRFSGAAMIVIGALLLAERLIA